MDPLRLLSRSTKLSQRQSKGNTTPSSGQNAHPQLFPEQRHSTGTATSRKRKRGHDASTTSEDPLPGLDFFGPDVERKRKREVDVVETAGGSHMFEGHTDQKAQAVAPSSSALSEEEAKAILKQHKLKVTWLNPVVLPKVHKRKDKNKVAAKKVEKPALFPPPLTSFRELQDRFNVSRRLADNIDDQGYSAPTEVQLGALPVLLDNAHAYLPLSGSTDRDTDRAVDLLTVAPTGSGKTLAFMIPLVHRVQQRRRTDEPLGRHTSAIVVAPTKELVGQIVNEGRKLAKGTGVQITQFRKGMHLGGGGGKVEEGNAQINVKSDVLVCTPGLLHSALEDADEAKEELRHVQDMVLDEADVLLDPLFREQTLGIWNRLPHAKLRVSLWSATMGSNIEELARTTIDQRRARLSLESGTTTEEAPLLRLVVGLKDSAVPNVQHKLVYAATEQGKLMGLRQLLHPASTSADSGPPLLPPFLVFTQTIERAVALHAELLYDIPAEAGGISRIAVLHSDLSDTARDSVMTRFRKGEIWVLITTDLLSRGVDFRGVNGVVNYDIPTSSAAYVHRVGRTGRAGRQGGVAVTLYSKEDIPYLKHIANVVAAAQKQNGASTEDSGMQQWLLDALPTLSKPGKQKLKKRGIESRTARAKDSDPKAHRRARITTKSGFVRKQENNRRGAVRGSQHRAQAEVRSDAGDETDFGGFD